nr:MAG TPA: hypothetical protein [Caudoviricetes sp.]
MYVLLIFLILIANIRINMQLSKKSCIFLAQKQNSKYLG